MRHTLAITTSFDDGHVAQHHYEQPGTAQDAHDNLARRWKDSGATFTRDRDQRILTRRYEITDGRDEVGYVDEIRHEDIS